MPPPPKPTSRFRNFLARIFPFLTRKQQKAAIQQSSRPSRPGPTADAAPSRPSVAAVPPVAAPAGATTTEREIIAREQEADYWRQVERDARQRKEALEVQNVAQKVPTRSIKEFKEEKGFTYNTWFKAVGSFGAEWGGVDADSPHLIMEDDDASREFGVDAAFTSRSKLGQVKWKGRVEREVVIRELNDKAFQGDDFRDIYPTWEYRWFLTKQIGDVVVGIFEHKARHPLSAKDRQAGYEAS